ncbi:hypothetical protein O181_024033 [Austropuccinia psidii MF-1]|uniref:Reverse transcriptase domain-containing protein n=1 Tax=Austropuccinia psidii MF-1 TaxID=1389203 RepID=A0A9Q3CJZ1_9BASI|nr:hypothetical protein [Austropuccinia psidii MF-1]
MVEHTSFPSFEWDVLFSDTPEGENLILGFEFLNNFKPTIDLRQGLITFNSEHKDYYDPSKDFSNEFSSGKSCAALFCDSRTPSLPSSVHIPSLNSHQSSLPARDEEYNLPVSSYHDSLEELWNEEVKTVMKVVASAYHQYSDLFSKVKAEKRPPHHACDHHIEPEGSLPPDGVIYSVSNQESDTLRDYISESLKKVFIQPSSSSTGTPVFFVKTKDGGLRFCVAYHKLNPVTRKNKYPVPPMNQLLNVFNGSSIFSKRNLHSAYNLLRIKEGDEHLTAFRTKY